MTRSLALLVGGGLAFAPSAFAVPDACDLFGPPTTTEPLLFADALVEGVTANEFVGFDVANIGDFDGDGNDDLAVAAPGSRQNGSRSGAVYLFLGPIADVGSLDSSKADHVLVGPSGGLRAGISIAGIGDIDQDGRADLIVAGDPTSSSAYPTGVAWVVLGTNALPALSDLDTEATGIIEGVTGGDDFGFDVAGIGDINGDSTPDFVIGAPTFGGVGAAFVFTGIPTGTVGVATAADHTFTGVLSNGRFGHAVAGIGDLDGDGFDDLAIGAPKDSGGGNQAGAAYVFYGSLAFAGDSADNAPLIIQGNAYDRMGFSLASAGDTDLDGANELAVGAKQYGGQKRGAVYVFNSALGLVGTLAGDIAYQARILGFNANDLMGTSVAGNIDVDNDGELDLVVGAERADGPSASATGAAWVVPGPLVGDIVVLPGSGARYGQQRYAFAGSAVAAFPDLNGDGFGDIVVGAWRATPGAVRRIGHAALFLGGQDIADETTWYADTDTDTWGDDGSTQVACDQPVGFVDVGGDCNDGNSSIHPFAPETDCFDPVDYNCDGSVGNVDNDADGVNACAGDCDDNAVSINPSADELCGDRLDNDCDGLFDDSSAVDAQYWYPDVDDDGYGDQTFETLSCTEPTGFLDDLIHVGGDCADTVVTVNPAAAEYCDTFDNNCDGFIDESTAVDASLYYFDDDGDGYGDIGNTQRSCAPVAGYVDDNRDCDDKDVEVYPGAIELCDGVDNDCDGIFYRGGPVQMSDVEFRARAETIGDRLGDHVAMLPDMNGDGTAELAMGAASYSGVAGDGGAVYVRYGTPYGDDIDLGAVLEGDRRSYDARITTDRSTSFLGSAVAGGDINGDGIGDLIVGAYGQARPSANQGAVAVFYGPISGEYDLLDADLLYNGATGGDNLGTAVRATDLDGDGFDDLLIGAALNDGDGDRRGSLYIIYGSATLVAGRIDTVADASLSGAVDRDELGHAVAALGDINDDGFIDIAAGAPFSGALDQGAIQVVYGSASRFAGPLTTSVAFTGTSGGGRLGFSLDALGDFDGDGLDDAVFGGNNNNVFVLAGDAAGWTGGNVSLAARLTIEGDTGQRFGLSVAAAGDVNNDGLGDLLASAHRDDTNGSNAGAAYLIYGSATAIGVVGTQNIESFGRVESSTVTFPTFSFSNSGGLEGAVFYGTGPDNQAGRFVTGGRDVNGDGFADMMFGAPKADDDRGEVRVAFGGPYGLDVTSAPGAGWQQSLTVDGSDADWLDTFTFATGSPGAEWSISWDDTNIYIGSKNVDVGTGGPSHWALIYLGDGDNTGASLGRLFNTQEPTLPFGADYLVSWRADDGYASWSNWDGAAWQHDTNWFGTVGAKQENNTNQVVEFSIPRSAVGDPSELEISAFWIFEGAGSETTFHGVPADSFTNATYDPDPATYFHFDFGNAAAPAAYSSTTNGGGQPDVSDDFYTYYVDADADGQGDDTPITGQACPMHLPISFEDPLNPERLAIFDISLTTDCDDADDTIYAGAPETNNDGVDSDCDGYDGANNLPILDVSIAPAPVFTDDTAVATVIVTDPDAGTAREMPITLTYTWTVDGVLFTPATSDRLEGSTDFEKGQVIEVSVVANDGFEDTPAMVVSATVANSLPVTGTVSLSETDVNLSTTVTATSSITDADTADAGSLTQSCQWQVDAGTTGSFADMAGITGDTMTDCSTSGLCADGDTVRAVCTPNDGDDDGIAVASAGIAVIAGNTPPVATVCDITPAAPTTTADLVATKAGTDADGDTITWTYTWYADGVAIPGQTAATLTAANTGKGIAYSVDCIPSDAALGTSLTSGGVTVLNTAPTAPVVSVSPDPAYTIDELLCSVDTPSTDADGDTVTYTMTWQVDGVAFAGITADTTHTGDTVPAPELTNGVWTCIATPNDGEEDGPTGTDNVTVLKAYEPDQVVTNDDTTCVLLDGGDVKCWGRNEYGQVGQGDILNRGNNPGEMAALAPLDLGTGRTATQVVGGRHHFCAVLDDRSVKCWGRNQVGQLGLGDVLNRGDGPGQMGDALLPVDLDGSEVVQLDSYNNTTCARLRTAELKCWGANNAGQLGAGDTSPRGAAAIDMGANLPTVDLGTGALVVDVALGFDHACALLSTGDVKCWGDNAYGNLGQGHTADLGDAPGEMGDALPTVDLGGGKVLDLDTGARFTCARFDDGTIKCWGRSSQGQLGNGNTNSIGDGPLEMGIFLATVDLGPGAFATDVDGGANHTCASLDDGTVKCWGFNTVGQLGLGDVANRGDGPGEMGASLPAVELSTTRNTIAMTAGYDHTCALLECGEVTCWGYNQFGSLGYDDERNRGNEPIEMGDALPTTFLGTGRYADVDIADPAFCTPWEHSITVDGDDSDWLAEETFATSSAGSTALMISWDDTWVYFGARHAEVQTGTAESWFHVYFGNGTDRSPDPNYAALTEGVTYNTQAPALAVWAQTAARYNADFSFSSALNGENLFGVLQAWNGTYPYFDGMYAPPIYDSSGPFGYDAQVAENDGNQVVEFRIRRDELYLHNRLYVQGQWLFEGAGFESSFGAAPDDMFVEGDYDPDFATFMRFELDNANGPADATIEAKLIP